LDEFVKVLENEVQIAVLSLFALMYVLRLLWLRSLRQPMEKMEPKGSARRGILLSFGSVFMPWSMESTRKHLAIYAEFALFHIAIAIAIGATFIHPYAKGALTDPVVYTFVGFLAVGTLVGVLRAVRRLSRPEMRAISTPDDYFAISIITIYFPAAIWGLLSDSNWGLTAYFGLTAFLLIYLPWSKISHYLYWPFTRFYHGFLFGRRGVTTPRLRSTTEV
jgi:nitrate reductase gamma subunit